MGAPAELTADERQYVADLADRIIDETERDGDRLLPAIREYAYSRRQDTNWSILAMAQEIRRGGREVELLRRLVKSLYPSASGAEFALDRVARQLDEDP